MVVYSIDVRAEATPRATSQQDDDADFVEHDRLQLVH
jgi:hypothetical protein